LISAIRRAANGEILFEKEQVERAFQWVKNVKDRWESLSDREREILQLLTEGKDNKTIAGALEITINTVEKYLSNIYKKLGVTSRTAAILWWLEKSTDFRT
jgi:DNA-binding NarL/FixJ family response regulator